MLKDYFNAQPSVSTVTVEDFIQQVNRRNSRLGNQPINNFNKVEILKFLENDNHNQNRPWGCNEYLINGELTESGCRRISSELKPNLDFLIQSDISSKFHGQQNAMIAARTGYSNNQLQGNNTSTFNGMDFQPPGVSEPFYFPNGTRGISSMYLANVSKILFDEGKLYGKNPKPHNDIIKKIINYTSYINDKEINNSLEYSYFDIAEGLYLSPIKEHRRHLWMSPDLCLAIAGSEHVSIQMKIIEDINRLQTIVQSYTNQVLPDPSVQSMLPGTVENIYREQGLVDLLTGEKSGCYAISRVRRMWCEQLNRNELEFDSLYGNKATYRELYLIAAEHMVNVLDTSSATGGTVRLFPLVVLKDYFREVDFSSLDK